MKKYPVISRIYPAISCVLKTRRRRRKVIAVFLILLILITSVRLYALLNPPSAKAATVELSTTSNTVQIDVANRYRAIMTTDDTQDYILISDRAQDDVSPDNVIKIFGSAIKDEPTWYTLRWNDSRITTILESNSTRVRIRVEGCFDTTGGNACIKDVAGGNDDVIEVTEEYTFTTEGMFVSTKVDFNDGLELTSTNGDRAISFAIGFSDINDNNIIAYSEEIRYGNGETDTYRSTSGIANGDDDGYYVLQATGDYQDVILGTMNLNGDKILSNSSNGSDYYGIDDVDEAESLDLYDPYTQTIKGKGSGQFFLQLHDQNKLNTEKEREAMFNDLTNPDYLSHVTGDLWDEQGGFFRDNFETGNFSAWDSTATDGGDLSVTTAAGLAGTDNGMQAVVDDTNGIYGGINLTGFPSGKFRVRFYIDPNGITIPTGNNFMILRVQDSGTWHSIIYLYLGYDGSNYYLQRGWGDDRGWIAWGTAYTITDAVHYVEIYCQRESSDGAADGSDEWWIDGVSQESRSDLQNWNVFVDVDYLHLGAVANIDTGTSGTFYLDELIVNDSGLPIGPFDSYNESEGVYTADMAVSDAEVDIDAGPNTSTLLSAGVSAGATSISVDSTTGFPSSGVAYIEGDKFSYTGKTGTTFTGIPSQGELSIIGHTDNSVVSSSRRHSPLYKFRNYRKNDVPQYITLEHDTLTQGAEYNASVKPFSTSYFAQDLTWHSTFESSGAVTSPDVGSAGTVNGTTTFTTGKYGNGMLSDASNEGVSLAMADNLTAATGVVEFWYNNTTTASGWNTFFSSSKGNDQFNLQRAGSDTSMELCIGNVCTIWSLIPSVYNGEWHHIRLSYDTTANSTYLYLDGVSQGQKTTDFPAIDTAYNLNIGNHWDGSIPINGIIDEFRIFSSNTTPSQVAKGGNAADSDEYLADATNDYTFDFNNDDANNRGEYIWLGSDAPFAGVNMDLATDGVGSSEDFDWEYWNGTSWSALTVTDQDTGAHSFTADGNFYFTPPADWFPYSVNGSTDLYYIRGHLEDGSYSTDPIENRIQTDILLIHYQDNIIDENQTLYIPAITSRPNPPVVYWNLDEGYGTTANDSSGHGNHGTISGATWQSEDLCYSGKCLYFDGIDDEITRIDDPQFDSDEGGSFTIQAWIRHPDISTNPDVIAAKFESTGGDGGYRIQMESDGDISFGIDDENTSFPEDSVTSTTANYDDNKWHHVTAVKDANDNLYLYIDGQLIDTDNSISATDSLDNNDDFYLGIDGDGSSNPWDGFIDEFKFYRYARSADEIKTDFQHNSAVRGTSASFSDDKSFLSEGLVGYWKMDNPDVDSEGETSTDSSGNGNDGTLYGDNGVGDNGTGMDCTANGKYGTGCELDGTDDYVNIGDDDTLDGMAGLTLSAWIKSADTSTTHQRIVSKWSSSKEYQIYLDANNNRLYFEVDTAGGSTTETGYFVPNQNEWYHVAGTYDGSEARIYVNGELNHSFSTGISGNIDTGTDSLSIGSSSAPSMYFDGLIDEARIYNRALTVSEVERLYHWAPGPIGYWPMDEASWTNDCSTDSVFDRSGNGNHGDACPSSTGPTGGAVGKFGKAGEFDGSNDYVSTSLAPPTSGTISVWFKSSVMPPDDIKMMVGNVTYGSPPTKRSYLGITTGSKLGGGLGDNNVAGNTTLFANTWYHGAITWDGSAVNLYLNGVNDYSGAQSGIVAINTFYLGAGSADGSALWFFPGLIDDAKIYNYARTPSQIIEDMNAGHPVGGSPLPSQVGYWTFDEGYGDTANDSSSQNNDGDLAGANSCPGHTWCPSWSNSGKFDKALHFDGDDDVVSVSHSTSYKPDDEITITGWFNTDDWDATFDVTATGNTQMRLFTAIGGGYQHPTIQLDFDTAGTKTAQWANQTISSGEWHHIAGVYDGTYLIIYFDGIARKTTYVGSDTINHDTNNLLIGQHGSDNADGLIDEVKIYNVALTADQIKLDYNQSKAVVWGATSTDSSGNPTWSAQNEYCPPGQGTSCTAPVGHWKLDEKTGTTANDTSGNGHAGAFSNNTIWKHAGECKHGACVEFDGEDDSIDVPDHDDFSANTTNELSVEGWVNWDILVSNSEPLSKSAGSNSEWSFFITDNGVARARTFQADGSDHMEVNSAVGLITTNRWYHIAMTVDLSAPSLKLYVDGMLIGEDTVADGSYTNGTATVSFGEAAGGWNDFDGTLDDIRIYDYERTQSQVAWSYNRGGPVGYWQLDECSGTTAYDASGKGNNGTINIGSSGSNTSAGTCSGSSGEAWYHGATGKRNASLDFDGTDDYVNIADPGTGSLFDFTDQMTISAWIKTSNTSEQAISAKNEASFYFTTSSGGNTNKLCFYLNVVSTDWLCSNKSVTDGEWHHVLASYDGSNRYLYIDGRLDNTTSSSGNMGTGNTDIFIGRRSTSFSYWFDGQIDDVKIFNYALSPEQIRNEYNQGAVFFGPLEGSP